MSFSVGDYQLTAGIATCDDCSLEISFFWYSLNEDGVLCSRCVVNVT